MTASEVFGWITAALKSPIAGAVLDAVEVIADAAKTALEVKAETGTAERLRLFRQAVLEGLIRTDRALDEVDQALEDLRAALEEVKARGPGLAPTDA